MEFTPEQIANRKAWVQELRSGKYTQGTGRLKQLDEDVCKYCCLGVAAEGVLSLHMELVGDTTYAYSDEKGQHYTGTLDEDSTRGMGIEFDGRFTGMNDYEDLPFEAIADYIETETAIGSTLDMITHVRETQKLQDKYVN